MDKKPVSTLSTLAQADVTHTAQRKQKDGPVQCTDAVMLYNQYRSGVDKGDQLRQYYRVRMRCMKYYKYIFWFLFDVSITSSYILSLFTPTTMSISYRRQLQLTQTIGPSSDHTSTSTPCQLWPPSCTGLSHHSPLPSHQKERRQCIYCSQYRNPPLRHGTVRSASECHHCA